MKMFTTLLVALLAATPAAAQWATPNHSVPVGRGAGVIGQGSAGPGASGLPLLGQGASADPVFGQVPNGGITAGSTDTVKGSIDGATISDIALPNCPAQGVAYSTGAHAFSCTALAFGMPVNLQINATVATNALTIAVKANNGTDPSATNPVLIPFRDVTIANGDPVIRSLQTALSFTINSGNAMGCVNAQMCRLWVIAIDNAGTIALCAYNATSAPAGVFASIVGLNEQNVATSQASTNGGASAQLLYCNTSAITAKSIRHVGYVEIQEATAGTWATAPTYTQLAGPGTFKPGAVVQDIYATSATQTTGGSGGTQAPTVPAASITPTSAANLIRVIATGSLTQNTTGSPEAQLYRAVGGSAACTTAFGSLNISNVGSGGSTTFPVTSTGVDVPNSTGQRTYAVCILNSNVGQNITYCSSAIAQSCTIELQEIMGALEPANDNNLLEMAG